MNVGAIVNGETTGVTTVMVADALLPGPITEVTAVVVLFLIPAVVPVTFRANVQDPLAGSVAPVRLTVPEPAVAVLVPPHELVNSFGVATTNPAGKVSLNPTPDSEAAFGLVIVKAKLVVPFNEIDAAPKALAIDDGSPTVIVADALLPVPPSVATSDCPTSTAPGGLG